MKYQVLDNGKPAGLKAHKEDKDWNQSIFNTLEEAKRFADNYFHPFCHSSCMFVNIPCEYGDGHFAQIIEIRSKGLDEVLQDFDKAKEAAKEKILEELQSLSNRWQSRVVIFVGCSGGIYFDWESEAGAEDIKVLQIAANYFHLHFENKFTISPQ